MIGFRYKHNNICFILPYLLDFILLLYNILFSVFSLSFISLSPFLPLGYFNTFLVFYFSLPVVFDYSYLSLWFFYWLLQGLYTELLQSNWNQYFITLKQNVETFPAYDPLTPLLEIIVTYVLHLHILKILYKCHDFGFSHHTYFKDCNSPNVRVQAAQCPLPHVA